jgi:hypothetical protein
MRNIIFILILGLFSSCQPKELPTIITSDEDSFVAKFSHMTTKTEMEQVAKAVAENGGELDFSRCSFYDNGKLQKLSIAIKAPNGSSGATGADIVGLQYGYYGFYWGTGGFGVGPIK